MDKVWEQLRHPDLQYTNRLGLRAPRSWNLTFRHVMLHSQKFKIAVKPARRLATVLFRSTYAKRPSQTRNAKETRRTLLFSSRDVSKLCAWIDLPLFIEDIVFSSSFLFLLKRYWCTFIFMGSKFIHLQFFSSLFPVFPAFFITAVIVVVGLTICHTNGPGLVLGLSIAKYHCLGFFFFFICTKYYTITQTSVDLACFRSAHTNMCLACQRKKKARGNNIPSMEGRLKLLFLVRREKLRQTKIK